MTCKVSKRPIYSNPYPQAGLGICSLVFQTNLWFFCEQKSNSVIHLLFRAITLSLFLKERHEQIAHFCSFDMSDLSKSIRSLFCKERQRKSLKSLFKKSKWGKGGSEGFALGQKEGENCQKQHTKLLVLQAICSNYEQITHIALF